MISASFSRRFALLAALTSSILLASCGSGGSDGGTTSVRALNLTSDLPSADVYVGGNKQFSALATGALANYVSLDANSYTVNVNSAGNSTALFTGSYSLSKDAHYTAVVWGPQASLRVSTLPEDEDTSLIATGNTRIRMFNATTETGSVDVYLTASSADLNSSTATQGGLTTGTLAGFREIPAGTYRLRVTGVGNPDDIRLDVDNVTLGAGKYATLMLTAGSGGVLVNGQLIVQQGTATALNNTKARVRVVASVDSSGSVTGALGGTLLASGLTSPAVGTYALVDAGTNVALTLRLNGATVVTGGQALVAGSDYTILAYGSAAAFQWKLITDDNRLPISTARAKIRLVNGVASLDGLTLLVNFGSISASSNITAGMAAPYAQTASSTGTQIQVDSATTQGIYQTNPAKANGDALAGQGVYTLFVLSGRTNTTTGAVAPLGILRNERP
jgi:hypothetical protein